MKSGFWTLRVSNARLSEGAGIAVKKTNCYYFTTILLLLKNKYRSNLLQCMILGGTILLLGIESRDVLVCNGICIMLLLIV